MMPARLLHFENGKPFLHLGGDRFLEFCPTRDLNQMREAEKHLSTEQLEHYADILCDDVSEGDPDPNVVRLITLKADQCARAFVKAIGKWKS